MRCLIRPQFAPLVGRPPFRSRARNLCHNSSSSPRIHAAFFPPPGAVGAVVVFAPEARPLRFFEGSRDAMGPGVGFDDLRPIGNAVRSTPCPTGRWERPASIPKTPGAANDHSRLLSSFGDNFGQELRAQFRRRHVSYLINPAANPPEEGK
jgi:hypothetical protein